MKHFLRSSLVAALMLAGCPERHHKEGDCADTKVVSMKRFLQNLGKVLFMTTAIAVVCAVLSIPSFAQLTGKTVTVKSAGEAKGCSACIEMEVPDGDDPASKSAREIIIGELSGMAGIPAPEHYISNAELQKFADSGIANMLEWMIESFENEEVSIYVLSSRFAGNESLSRYVINRTTDRISSDVETCTIYIKNSDGKKLDNFFKPGVEKYMQDILYNGLKSYFISDSGSFDPNILNYQYGSIPLPSETPALEEDGLYFSYEKGEVAPPYCAFPGFFVPFSKLTKFLDPAFLSLIN